MIHFVDIKPGDPLPPEATVYHRTDRRRLAASLRHLCPELTAEEATALSWKPGANERADITVDRCKELIMRELPALRALCECGDPLVMHNDGGSGDCRKVFHDGDGERFCGCRRFVAEIASPFADDMNHNTLRAPSCAACAQPIAAFADDFMIDGRRYHARCVPMDAKPSPPPKPSDPWADDGTTWDHPIDWWPDEPAPGPGPPTQ